MAGYSGTFNGYKLTWVYNSRLQSCRIHVTTGSVPADPCTESPPTVGNILDLAYDFNLGAANNGNVMQTVNNADNSRTQMFTYDQLNRLAMAWTQATTGPKCFGYVYGYDIWANLTTRMSELTLQLVQSPGAGHSD